MLPLSLCVPLLSQSPSLPDAAALLDRREAALGPAEKRAGPHGLTVEGVWGMGEAEAQAAGMSGAGCSERFEERHLIGPDGERVLCIAHYQGMVGSTQGTDGRVSWTAGTGFGVSVKEGSEQMSVRRMWAIQRSAPWRSLYASARTLGEVERDGRALYELEMLPREGKPERWYLDRATNELARVAVVYPGPSGGVMPMEFTLGDWRAVDGVLYPFRRGQEVQGGVSADSAHVMKIDYVCTSIRRGPLAPADVAPPPEVAEAILDPRKRTPEPPADPARCQLETIERQHTASVRLEIDSDKVSDNIAMAFGEVGRVLQEQGIELVAPPFTRYHAIDTVRKKIDFEAGMAVKTPIRASGRVEPGELPGGRAAMTWHVGSYHQLQQSYDRLEAWMKAEKLNPRGGFWEVYWTDPGLEPDPSSWRTQILWPVE